MVLWLRLLTSPWLSLCLTLALVIQSFNQGPNMAARVAGFALAGTATTLLAYGAVRSTRWAADSGRVRLAAALGFMGFTEWLVLLLLIAMTAAVVSGQDSVVFNRLSELAFASLVWGALLLVQRHYARRRSHREY